MPKEKITCPKEAAEKISYLLNEKKEIEEEIDKITRVKNIMSREEGKNLKSASIVVNGRDCWDGSFHIDEVTVTYAVDRILNEHSERLDQIDDDLLAMVKLID